MGTRGFRTKVATFMGRNDQDDLLYHESGCSHFVKGHFKNFEPQKELSLMFTTVQLMIPGKMMQKKGATK